MMIGFLTILATPPMVKSTGTEVICTPDNGNADNNIKSRQHIVKNKIQLLKMVALNSPTAKRIIQSNNTKATSLLEVARNSYLRASALLKQKCITASEIILNKGLKAIESASRIVVDTQRIRKTASHHFQQLSDRITSFHNAYKRIIKENTDQKLKILDQNQFDGLLEKARGLAHAGHFNVANKYMTKAGTMIEIALAIIRDHETLVHEYKFDSLDDEFAYAARTNNSYIKLLNIVLDNLATDNPKRSTVNTLVERNLIYRADADKAISDGKMEDALRSIEKGTDSLIRALRFIGVRL